MLSKFEHPNVILVLEIFESEDSFYSVMEYCEGGELFNYIVKKNRLSEDEAAFFFYQLINGLEYIHSLGIVHRDLKPENLLLTSEHILKIIDFGLSNYFKENQEPLLSTPCGSPCYASPEMVAGKKYNGFKIDIWSCGIILYAMLCGYLPFEDPDNEVLFKKILECNLEFPSYIKKLSIDLITKILVTDPEKRITIPEIKKHPFFLKGKEIFEQEFNTTFVTRSPNEANNEENEIEKNLEEKENINEMNEIKKEDKNNEDKQKLVEIALEDKENINDKNINKKEIKKDKERYKNEKKKENLELIEKPKEKEENIEKEEKEEKNIKIKNEEKKIEKPDKTKKIEKQKKLGIEKSENEENEENLENLEQFVNDPENAEYIEYEEVEENNDNEGNVNNNNNMQNLPIDGNIEDNAGPNNGPQENGNNNGEKTDGGDNKA